MEITFSFLKYISQTFIKLRGLDHNIIENQFFYFHHFSIFSQILDTVQFIFVIQNIICNKKRMVSSGGFSELIFRMESIHLWKDDWWSCDFIFHHNICPHCQRKKVGGENMYGIYCSIANPNFMRNWFIMISMWILILMLIFILLWI